jgi:hypothetical protein
MCVGNAATAVADSSRGLQVSNESARAVLVARIDCASHQNTNLEVRRSAVNFAYRLLNDRHGAKHWIVRDVGCRRGGATTRPQELEEMRGREISNKLVPEISAVNFANDVR